MTAARAALEKQAEQVVILDLRGLSTVTDFFIIATADNARQLGALQEHIADMLVRSGVAVWHTEGAPGRLLREPGRAQARPPRSAREEELHWVLMDCGDVVVHLLDPRARLFYRLEDLWADAPRVPVIDG